MTLPKLLAALSITLFSLIGIIALFKGTPNPDTEETLLAQAPLEVELDENIQTVAPTAAHSFLTSDESSHESPQAIVNLPEEDRIEELFNKDEPRLPIVETVTYRSHVAWQKGRPAWLSDYASHYDTSRHFIARSLNGTKNYLKQEVKEGDHFNVFRKGKNFNFYLLVDSSRCKMWLYYVDLDEKQKVLLKTYQVGLGRLDSAKISGILTPLGTYKLGENIAIYKPKTMGNYKGKSTEMITIFGTRWIPFEKEMGTSTAPAKGFGIHGTPWKLETNGHLIDQISSIGKYESDGCIRLATADMEEIFAIIITKPAIIEIVRDFSEATFAEKMLSNAGHFSSKTVSESGK
jgi:hypothetical protein